MRMMIALVALLASGCGAGVYPDNCVQTEQNGVKTVTITYPPILNPFLPPIQIPPITVTIPDQQANQCGK